MRDLLRLSGIEAGYRGAVVLRGIDLTLEEGQSIALLGRNGVGKTTLINTIIGVTRRVAGTIHMGARDLTAMMPEQRAAAGIGWVPQERNIFKSLTVLENLTAVAQPGPWSANRVFEIFPHLAERRKHLGNQLSGGEQQMLAIGRALMLNPKVILLDEPTEGLAPLIVEELLRTLRGLFKSEGLSAIVVEQRARKVLTVTNKAIVLDRGTIVYRAASEALRSDDATLERFLGVSGGKLSKSFSMNSNQANEATNDAR